MWLILDTSITPFHQMNPTFANLTVLEITKDVYKLFPNIELNGTRSYWAFSLEQCSQLTLSKLKEDEILAL